MRHLLKSLLVSVVLSLGSISSLVILTKYSFLGSRVNTITFWCIILLLAAIWIAFAREALDQNRDKIAARIHRITGPVGDSLTRALESYDLSCTAHAEEEASAETDASEAVPAPEAEPATEKAPAAEKPSGKDPAADNDSGETEKSDGDEVSPALFRQLQAKKLHHCQQELDLLMEKQRQQQPTKKNLRRMKQLEKLRDELVRRMQETEE